MQYTVKNKLCCHKLRNFHLTLLALGLCPLIQTADRLYAQQKGRSQSNYEIYSTIYRRAACQSSCAHLSTTFLQGQQLSTIYICRNSYPLLIAIGCLLRWCSVACQCICLQSTAYFCEVRILSG